MMATVVSMVAILAGLVATLVLVVTLRKALPALPVSIVLGIAMYFATRYSIEPFVQRLFSQMLFY